MDFLLQNKILILFFLAYLLIISVVAFAVTLYDKWAAVKRPQERTRESTLLLLSALGGSMAMQSVLKKKKGSDAEAENA